MDNLSTFLIIGLVAAIVGFIISLIIMQWFHKIGFKISKVSSEDFPGFFRRFFMQILTILFAFVLMNIIIWLLSFSTTVMINSSLNNSYDIDYIINILLVYSKLITFMMNMSEATIVKSISFIYLLNGLIFSLQYLILLSLSSLVLVRNLSFTKHLTASLVPGVFVFIVSGILPMFLISNYMTVSGI